jgi:uncharacterized protein involved in exopolysaccharide biosynthesis
MLDYRLPPKRHAAPSGASARGKLTASEAFALAQRHKWLVLGAALAGAVASVLGAHLIPPRYVATSQIYVDPRVLPFLDKEATQGADATGFLNFVESQTRVVVSQIVLEKVVKSEHLSNDPEFGGAALFDLGSNADGNEQSRAAAALRALASRVVVRRPERTSVIEVSVASREPAKAARLANAVADSFIASQATIQSDFALRTETSLGKRLESLREGLLAAERELEDYKAKNGFVGSRTEWDGEQQLKELSQQMAVARVRAEEARSRWESAQRARRSGGDLGQIAEILNIPSLTNLRAQQAEASQKLADLSSDLGPLHPSVRSASARVSEVRREVDRELARIGGALQKEYERTKTLVDGLADDIEALQKTVANSGQASVRLHDLERGAAASRSLYEAMLSRSLQVGELQRIEPSNAHVITMAAPPVARSFPPPAAVTAGGGLLLGLGFGVAAAFWRERRARGPALSLAGTSSGDDKSIFDKDSEAGSASVSLVGSRAPSASMPHLRIGPRTTFVLHPRRPGGESLNLSRIGLPCAPFDSDRRELHAVLDAVDEADDGSPLILVTGAADGPERATLAVNLLLAAAFEGLDATLISIDEPALRIGAPLGEPIDASYGSTFIEAAASDLPSLLNDKRLLQSDLTICVVPIGASDVDRCFEAADHVIYVETEGDAFSRAASRGVSEARLSRVSLVVDCEICVVTRRR